MRTTITLEDELLALAKQRALDLGLSLSDVVNRILRQGLTQEQPTRLREGQTITYGAEPLSGPDDAQLRAWQQRLDDELR